MVKIRRNLLELFDNRQMMGTDRLALATGGQQMEGMLSSGGREKGGGAAAEFHGIALHAPAFYISFFAFRNPFGPTYTP